MKVRLVRIEQMGHNLESNLLHEEQEAESNLIKRKTIYALTTHELPLTLRPDLN